MSLKNKTDFYIAFYEQLALQGFRAYMPAYDYDKKHIADICLDGYNIARLTKEDRIEQNPHAEAPSGTIEKIREIARNTALKFAACAEKPYDPIKNHQFSDGSYKLAEYNGIVLACAPHHLFGYVFSTFNYPNDIGQPGERETFFSQADATRDFTVRSGLLDSRQFFSEKELSMMHANLLRVRLMMDDALSSDETEEFDALIEKIEGIVPELADLDVMGFEDLVTLAEMSEGVTQ